MKACSTIAVLERLRTRGALVDVVSHGELTRALAAGWVIQGDPPPIVYTADLFDRESLACCTSSAIHVNCGSLDMISQLGPGHAGREITLRLNPGFGSGHSQKVNTGGPRSKHGIWHEQLDEALDLARSHGLVATGLHVHIGSGVDFDHLARVCAAVEDFAPRFGTNLRSISGGGGLPIPYREQDPELDISQYLDRWQATRDRLQARLGAPLRLEVEPGRFLLASSGALIAEVRAVKRQGTLRYALLDAGFTALARPVLYGSYHPIAVVPADDAHRPLVEIVVGGPLCESGDIFTQNAQGVVETRLLPEPRVGDWMLIGVAGAYGSAMASNYNSQQLPAEVLIENGQARLIRRRQSLDEQLCCERDLA
jgi:diaminopimelate decarboxylase